MESLISLPDYIRRDYDPFANPPDFSAALQHRKATLVGNFHSKIKSKLCECCMLPINKQPIDLRCGHSQLSFLGTSLVMYFNLLKVTIILFSAISIPLVVLQTIILNKQYLCCVIFTQILISLSLETEGRLYFIISSWISLTGLAHLLKRYSQKEIYILQNSHPSQEDYTLKCSNLPSTDQRQLKKFVEPCLMQKVTNIELAYDISQMHQAFARREELTLQKNKIEKLMFKNGIGLFSPQKNASKVNNCKSHLSELNSEINRLDQTLSKYRHYLTFTPYKQIGIAFISFESKAAADSALHRYKMLITKNQKQQLKFKQKQITVQKAINPKDVVWQNLNSEDTKINNYIQFSAIIAGLSVILFLLFLLTNYRGIKTILTWNPELVAFLIILISYSLFHFIVHLLVSLKRRIAKYSTHTSQQISSLRIYLILNTAFACVLPYLLSDNQEQLILYINFVAFLDAFIHPLIKIFNCNHIYQKMLAEYIKKLQPCKNYYTQEYINRLLEGRQFSLGENYHFLCRGVLVTSFFSTAAPLSYLYYTVALTVQYIVQKIILLRVSKTPPKISRSIIYFLISSILYAPAFFFVGLGVLKAQKQSLLLSNYYLEIVGLFLSIVFSQVSLIKEKKDQTIGKDCYYAAKLKFSQLYQTQNLIKKYDGSINSTRVISSQQIYSSPQWRDFDFFEQQKKRKESNMSQMRSIKKLMSYNNDYFDIFLSSEYKRLCDT